MERIQALIDKLTMQKNAGASPADLLLTTQLLQTELLRLQQKKTGLGTARIAVTLPLNFSPAPAQAPSPGPAAATPAPVEAPAPSPVAEAPAAEPAKPEPYTLKRPVMEPPPPPPAPPPSFIPVEETPTLAQQLPAKEVHELISDGQESLNDRLKKDQSELASTLKDTPIKDLRKGVGINDRYTFVNELFRGDEAMYERSIKTINSFNILSEAEYWISRELKFKLGWNDTRDTVQHFYHLVRRRFS